MEERDYQFVEHENPYTYRDGDLTVTRGSAWSGPGCHLGCGVLLYTNDEGDLVKVEGDPENPFNEGRLCVRCLDLPEMVNNPKRLTHPLRRAKADRGHDRWERIGWDEALDLIAAELNKVKEAYGPESVIFSCGTGRDIAPYITRLCWSFGSPNFVNIFSGNACYLPRVAGCIATTGAFWVADCAQQFPDRYDNPAWQMPETMFVWGNYPLIANSDGFFGHWVVDLMKRGMKIVMIDPKVTWLSAKAEVHLPVRPGTDAALALAMMNVIINEDLYDHDFVDRWCYGFEELSEHVQPFTPEYAETTTWVPAERIRKAARILAASRPATLQWGVAFDQTKWANGTAHAAVAVQALTGNIDNPGGFVGINFGYVQSDIRENIAKSLPNVREGRLGDDGNWGLMNAVGKGGHAIPEAILDAAETGVPYPVKMLFMCSTTAFTNMAGQARRVYDVYKDMDHVVVCDLFMTPTAMAIGDLFIPMAMGCERNGVRGWYTPLRSIVKVTQTGDAVGDEQMMLELGKKMNPDLFYWDDVPEMLEFCTNNMATVPIHITFSELREKVIVYPEFEYYKYKTGKLRFDGNPGFNTLSGRVELFCNMYNNVGMDPLPYFKEPPESPESTPELFAEYPLVLTTGRRCWEYFHSEHRQLRSMREFHKWPMFAINPADAEAAGIKEGDWAVIENAHGKAIEVAHVTDTIMKGVVSAEHGWWFPERDKEEPSLYGVWESNINCLTVQGDFGPSGYGSSYKTQLCRVYPAPEGYGAEFERMYAEHHNL